MKKEVILGVPFDALSFNEALSTLAGFLNSSGNHLAVTPNPEAVMLAQRDKNFMEIIQKADLVLPDGIGIIIAAKLLRLPIRERVPGFDIAVALLNNTAGNVKVYLLGAAPGIAEVAAKNLQAKGIQVCGARDGYFDQGREEEILDEINSLKPDILIIGMGMPKQEDWAHKNFSKLPCKITMCLGGSIDILAGNVKRAPKLMRAVGLEWLYRLISQPSRARRMLDLPRFIAAVLRLALGNTHS